MASITQSFPSVSHDFVEEDFKSVKEMNISKRDATKQAKIAEREATKQAKIAEREAAKQAKIAEREAVKQAKIAEREAAKQAKIAEREAAKQAKIAERDAEKEALKKRRERVREIKLLYKFQVIQTKKLLRKYRRDEEERIFTERIVQEAEARQQREREAAQQREREAARAMIRTRQSRAEQRAEEQYIAARLHSMNVAGTISILDRQPTGQLPERLTRGLPEPRSPPNPPPRRANNYVHYRSVNPIQELINKDLIDCKKKQGELGCNEDAFESSECPICFDELGNTNKMILRCGHTLCGDCIINHMQRVGGMKCPVCRIQYGVRVKGWQPPKK